MANPTEIPAAQTPTRASATDAFIGKLLPEWLRAATPQQIKRLRNLFKEHKAGQDSVRAATRGLVPLQIFALDKLGTLLKGRLPAGSKLNELEWLEPEGGLVSDGFLGFSLGTIEVRQSALLRLMQNFPSGATPLRGEFVVNGGRKVLYRVDDVFVKACRDLDTGRLYQTLIDQTFNAQTCKLLVAEKRAGLRLAAELAVIQGELNEQVCEALAEVADAKHSEGLHLQGYPGLLTMLGKPVADALVIALRDAAGEASGWVLYLPSDPSQALHHFLTLGQMHQAMVKRLNAPEYQNYFIQLIALEDRQDFVQLLQTRLKDPEPDLQMDGTTGQGDVFVRLVEQQVKRIKSDASLLLVPLAQADARAAKQRQASWKSLGWDVANLAGMFVPVVGELLLGRMLVQTVAEVYEGVTDWAYGHQHEALEHLLGVAETLAQVAVTGAVIGATGHFVRSRFVDGLEPVRLDNGQQRLWSSDLTVYESTPDERTLADDGLYGSGTRRWMRSGDRYHEVHRPQAEGPWRLRHPRGDETFGPVVEFNGERSWHVRSARPQTWDDSARMLDTLWPFQAPLSTDHAQQIVHMAGMNKDMLRGLIIENRPLPVTLRETLRRFDANTRIEAFFTSLGDASVVGGDAEIQAWCVARAGMTDLDPAALKAALMQQQPQLEGPLLQHLTRVRLPDDPVARLVKRDFPHLPDAYVAEVVAEVDNAQAKLSRLGRLSVKMATKARFLSQVARLDRAVQGVFLSSAYTDEAGELVINLLSRLPNWPSQLGVELRDGSPYGRLLTRLSAMSTEDETVSLVHVHGRFRLFDGQGYEHSAEVAEPGTIFQALAALLTPEQLGRMGLPAEQPAALLRAKLQALVPDTRTARLYLLGWREQAPWFNPGQRLTNGRVGYLLSGRGGAGTSLQQLLRARLGVLYRGLGDVELEQEAVRLQGFGDQAFQHLLDLEDSYNRLDRALNQWYGSELDEARQTCRKVVADSIRRAWRFQGEQVYDSEGNSIGQRLRLEGPSITTLPSLPLSVDFPRLVSLVINDTALTVVPVDFLHGLTALTEVNLVGNQLSAVPIGFAYLIELRTLRLARNNIHLNFGSISAINRLPRLEAVDLSYNPLGQYPVPYNQLSHLRELDLQQCRLGVWPSGLELCSSLEKVNLCGNHLKVIPEVVLRMPQYFRHIFVVMRNPLSTYDVQRLYAFDVILEEGVMPSPSLKGLQRARSLWVGGSEASTLEARGRQWDELASMPDSVGLFALVEQLERTTDYVNASEYLRGNLWTLLDALCSNTALRLEVFAELRPPFGSINRVVRRFSDLLKRAAIAQAENNTSPDRGNQLLNLGRGLFRLEQVERRATAETARRAAQGQVVNDDTIDTINLYYRVKLHEVLQLPFQPQTLDASETAEVSDAAIAQALRRVKDAETLLNLSHSLAQREFWQRYLRQRSSGYFTNLERVYRDRVQLIEQQRAELAPAEVTQRLDDLVIERDQDERALLVRLTHQLLYGKERGQA